MFRPNFPKLSDKQIFAAQLLAVGNAESEIARMTKVTVPTLRNWRQHSEFQACIELHRQDIWQGIMDRFLMGVGDAVTCLSKKAKTDPKAAVDLLKLVGFADRFKPPSGITDPTQAAEVMAQEKLQAVNAAAEHYSNQEVRSAILAMKGLGDIEVDSEDDDRLLGFVGTAANDGWEECRDQEYRRFIHSGGDPQEWDDRWEHLLDTDHKRLQANADALVKERAMKLEAHRAAQEWAKYCASQGRPLTGMPIIRDGRVVESVENP